MCFFTSLQNSLVDKELYFRVIEVGSDELRDSQLHFVIMHILFDICKSIVIL